MYEIMSHILTISISNPFLSRQQLSLEIRKLSGKVCMLFSELMLKGEVEEENIIIMGLDARKPIFGATLTAQSDQRLFY